MPNNIMDYVQTINGIPLCDVELREILKHLKKQLDAMINLDHHHNDVLIKKENDEEEDKSRVPARKETVDGLTIERQEGVDFSKFETEKGLEERQFLSRTSNNLITPELLKIYLSDLFEYINNTHVLKSDLNVLISLLDIIELEIKRLEDKNKEIFDMIEELKITSFAVEYVLSSGVTSTHKNGRVEENEQYSSKIMCDPGFDYSVLSVTMGGVDITDSCVTRLKSTIMINIPAVTGDVKIIASICNLCPISYNITNCSSSNNSTEVPENSLYRAEITPKANYEITDAIVTMSGKDITNDCLTYNESGGIDIEIQNVTGSVLITVKTTEVIKHYNVTNNLTDVISDNTANIATKDGSYTAALTCESSYEINNIKVIMNNVDVTKNAIYEVDETRKVIIIDKVIGDITITAQASIVYYGITYDIPNCTSSNKESSIVKSSEYSTRITQKGEYQIDNITVTMNGINITSSCVNNNSDGTADINISKVTGNVIITTQTSIVYYNIKYTLVNCTSSNKTSSIKKHSSYYINIVPDEKHDMSTVKVTMNDSDISNSCVIHNGDGTISINIDDVIGNIVITANATERTKYDITYSLTNANTSSSKSYVHKGESFNTTLSVSDSSMKFTSVTVTMNGIDITNSCCSITNARATIFIQSVTGHVHITAQTSKIEVICTKIVFSTSKLSVNSSSGTLDMKKYLVLTPSNATQPVTWHSDNQNIAISSNGLLTLSYKGSVKIQARCNDMAATINVVIS